MNTLYVSDSIKILNEYIAGESVDLVYLDPPFNSNLNYNFLRLQRIGPRSLVTMPVDYTTIGG